MLNSKITFILVKRLIFSLISGILAGIIFSALVIYRAKLEKILRNRFDGLATIFSACVVIVVYYIEQRNKKNNAARLVLKEIDGAIPVAQKLAGSGVYDQKTIAIATDNWPNQIHFFVKDMTQDEIGQINRIYSNGRYINKCIERVDEYKKTIREKIYLKHLEKTENSEKNPEVILNDSAITKEVATADAVPNALVNFAMDAAKEIKDAKEWTGYAKLRQIARVK